MNKLRTIENKYHIILPEIYKDFYEGAAELLAEDGVNNFLEGNDFVFMMHQGYIFWYFKADGDPDPIVYSYYEGKYKPENIGRFSDFIKEYTK